MNAKVDYLLRNSTKNAKESNILRRIKCLKKLAEIIILSIFDFPNMF
jgi:hypothetical protein